MKRFIYYAVSATDANVIPVDKILGMESTDDQSLVIHHDGFDDAGGGNVDLEIESGSVKAACKAIVEAINYSTNPFIVVGDDVNKQYLHPKIEDVTSTTD